MRFKINWIILPDRFLKILIVVYFETRDISTRGSKKYEQNFSKVYILLFELVLPVLESDKWEGWNFIFCRYFNYGKAVWLYDCTAPPLFKISLSVFTLFVISCSK